jgi:hypothetical protein
MIARDVYPPIERDNLRDFERPLRCMPHILNLVVIFSATIFCFIGSVYAHECVRATNKEDQTVYCVSGAGIYAGAIAMLFVKFSSFGRQEYTTPEPV